MQTITGAVGLEIVGCGLSSKSAMLTGLFVQVLTCERNNQGGHQLRRDPTLNNNVAGLPYILAALFLQRDC